MKIITTFIFMCCFSVLRIFAQPNITDSIYIQNKMCHANQNSMTYVYGSKFGSCYSLRNIVDANQKTDYQLFKLDTNFDTIWSRTFGGSQDDFLRSIHELSNGNLVLVGETQSQDGTLLNVGHPAANELWVVIVDTLGNTLYQIATGGNGSTSPIAVYISAYDDIYVGGSTMADNKDFTHTAGGGDDCFLAKFSSSLEKKWIKCWYGNDADDIAGVDKGFNDQEILLSIGTWSTDSLLGINGVKGQADGLLMKVDTSGTELWSKRYGGSLGDALRKTIADSANNVYYLVGETISLDGDITYKTGDSLSWGEYNVNIWVTKIDANGNVLYSKAYGTRSDSLNQNVDNTIFYRDALIYHNAIYILSYTLGGGGDLPPNTDQFAWDTWIAKIDTQCNLRGKLPIHSFKNDYPNCFFFKDNMPWVEGYSGNIANNLPNYFSCDTSNNFRYELAIEDFPLEIVDLNYLNAEDDWEVFPNPASGRIRIKSKTDFTEIRIYNSEGRIVNIVNNEKHRNSVEINIIDLSVGLYYVVRKSKDGQSRAKKISVQ